MGLFDKFKTGKMETEDGVIYAPMNGTVIPLEEIPDPVFSQGVVGPGCGLEPAEGELTAPFHGRVVSVTDTKHAVGVRSDDGIELLLHVGMDTVQMNGDGFSMKVKQGDHVNCGQLLLKFDINKIKRAGHPVTTAVIVTNAGDFEKVEFHQIGLVQKTKPIGKCKKK